MYLTMNIFTHRSIISIKIKDNLVFTDMMHNAGYNSIDLHTNTNIKFKLKRSKYLKK